MKEGIKAVGRSLLVVVGVGYGVVKALDSFGSNSGHRDDPGSEREDSTPSDENRCDPSISGHRHHASDPRSIRTGGAVLSEKVHIRSEQYENSLNSRRATYTQAASRRTDGVEERLSRIEKRVEDLNAAVERMEPRKPVSEADIVTRGEMNAALEDFSRLLDSDIERRFEVQDRSVQSLRTMIARTDELLERIIENLESTS